MPVNHFFLAHVTRLNFLQRQSRSSARPAPRPAPPQSRSASTATAPAGHRPNPATAPTPAAGASAPTQTGQPGMMAQMAATAGSVAIGSTIGHGLSSMLFGGSSSPPVEQQQQAAQTQAPAQGSGLSCELQAKGSSEEITRDAEC